MSDVNNANSVKEWLRKGCPTLSGKRIGVDFLAEKATEYSLYPIPSAYKEHENILGEKVLDEKQEQNYIFMSRMPYGSDVAQNIKNLQDLSEINAWIIEQNKIHNFPERNDGIIDAINPSLTPAMMAAGANTAQYQINIKVSYRLRRS